MHTPAEGKAARDGGAHSRPILACRSSCKQSDKGLQMLILNVNCHQKALFSSRWDSHAHQVSSTAQVLALSKVVKDLGSAMLNMLCLLHSYGHSTQLTRLGA